MKANTDKNTQKEIIRAAVAARESNCNRLIGERIVAARHCAGLSQQALGDKLGLSFQQIQKYETAANRVSISRLISIADACGVRLQYFLKDLHRDQSAQSAAPRPISGKAMSLAVKYDGIGSSRVQSKIASLITTLHEHEFDVAPAAQEVE